MLVFDATPLIYLATVDRLDVVATRSDDCIVPTAVHEEVVETGLDQGHADARRVDRAVEAGTFVVRDVQETGLQEGLASNDNLSDADAAVLALAAAESASAVMDEQYGRDVAVAEGIETTGTAALVLDAARSGRLSVAEARTAIDDMVDAGWFCSPRPYSTLLGKLADLESD